MSDIVGSAPLSDPKAAQRLADWYGTSTIRRSIVDGQRGYSVKAAYGVECFHFRLADAMRHLAQLLGHADDREILVIGEPEIGNAWTVER